jgi:hypothetical protein
VTYSGRPIYSRHARDRQDLRNVSDDEVEDVLANYAIDRPDKKGNRVPIGYPNGRYVKVVVALGSSPPFIITVAD